jgi:arylsulfatase A-like enzyme
MSLPRIIAPLPILLAILATALLACGDEPAARPNVLLVTIDTLRPDRLGAYGYNRSETPNIDRLAAEGALFETALTDTPWTTPSMSSVMTGTYATHHGFKSTNANRLSLENVTLAEVLSEAGYTTAAIIGSFPLDSIFQLDQGFGHYDDEFTTPIWSMPGHEFEHVESEFFEAPDRQRFFILSKALNDSRREDSEVTDVALAWLAEPRDEPFFLWVHYFGPHEKPDWRVAEDRRERVRIGLYDSDTENTDREVGRLLEGLAEAGRADDTLVVFHADHGESLGEQGLVGHGQLLNEATMRVPLILRYPARVAAGVRVPGLVRNVDIYPTILDAIGIEEERELSGESLLPLAAPVIERFWSRLSGRAGAERVAYMETYYPAHVAFATPVRLPGGSETKVGLIRRGVQTRDWKYVRSDPYELIDVDPASLPEVPAELAARLVHEELYDLNAENGESRNVVKQHPDVVAELREIFEVHLAAEAETKGTQPGVVDPEMKLRLKALGYGG